MTSITSTLTLANGVKMPMFGLGTWQSASGEETENAVKWALQCGYRHVDTAAIYKNEESVGAGIRASGVPRSEIFVTTKLWNTDQGYESTLAAFDTSLAKLGLDYIDLYLIHWPRSDETLATEGKKYLDTWRAFEKLYADKKVRAIGVSNFHEKHIDDILSTCTVAPMVNQIELHPLFNQAPLRAYCKSKNIAVTAWSPLGQGKLLTHPTIEEIAKKHQRTAAQVILRWDLQQDIITIPKSVKESRIKENADLYTFTLSSEDIERINAMHTGSRYGPDPQTAQF